MSNYKGSIINFLFTAAREKPTLTMGEILYSFLNKKSLGKHFLEADDEEIYTSLEHFVLNSDDEDEPFDEQGFDFWRERALICKAK